MPAAVGVFASSVGVAVPTETQCRTTAASTSYISTPDHADFTFSAFDVSWFGSLDNPGANDQGLLNHWLTTGSMREWSVRVSSLTPGPHFKLYLSTDGAGNVASTGTGMTPHGLTAGQYFGVRTTWRMSDGAVKFYLSLTDPPSWTLLGSTTLLAGGPLRDSTGMVQCCGNTSAGALGYFRRAEFWNGFDGAGTLIANPDVRAVPDTNTSFTDSTGKVWTLAGTADLVNRPVP